MGYVFPIYAQDIVTTFKYPKEIFKKTTYPSIMKLVYVNNETLEKGERMACRVKNASRPLFVAT